MYHFSVASAGKSCNTFGRCQERSSTISRIIFTSHYLRDAPLGQLQNYVRYIATREGVEKIDESKKNLPATLNQKNLIAQIIRDIPQSKDMLEYADFLLHSTLGNASEFISCALEQHVNLIGKRENYVDYIANRPRVERMGEHGLFTDAGKPVVLKQVQEEVARHRGAVWTHVISLRREDAVRLGYDSAFQWMALLRSERAMLSQYMKISGENLRWYAAFHNEGHHPHVHLMVYSAKDNDGYLTKPAIEAIRSKLAHDIFRQDFANIYEKQNQARAVLKSGAEKVLQEKMRVLRNGTLVNAESEQMMLRLAGRVQNTSGKKVYGYLKRDVKNLIDRIIDELEKDSRVSELYQAWAKWQDEILLTYRNEPRPLPPLSRQPQFKSIKNMVIAEAVRLGENHFTFEDEHALELEEGWESKIIIPEEKAAEAGNSAAQYALAKFCGDGEYVQRDLEKAVRFFTLSAEQGNEYAAYQLGKLYLAAEGIPKDVQTAVKWLEMASEKGNPYAQYALGKLYLTGGDVPRDKEKAVFYLQASAAQGNLYAQFFLEHLDSFQDPSIFLMATRLLHILEKLFQEDYRKGVGGSPYYIDRKRRRRLAEKKQAQGHKRDDYEPGQQFSG